MQLIAWKTIGKNPCDNPPVTITIAPITRGTHVYPWVLLLEDAVEMFGQEVIDLIDGEVPVPVVLTLSLGMDTPSKPTL